MAPKEDKRDRNIGLLILGLGGLAVLAFTFTGKKKVSGKTHTECIAGKCVTVVAPGVNECINDASCNGGAVGTHLECINNQCLQVIGAGADECVFGVPCQKLTHFECQNGQCVETDGEGPDTCFVDGDCPPAEEIECSIKLLETEGLKISVQAQVIGDAPAQLQIQWGDGIISNGPSGIYTHTYAFSGQKKIILLGAGASGTNCDATITVNVTQVPVAGKATVQIVVKDVNGNDLATLLTVKKDGQTICSNTNSFLICEGSVVNAATFSANANIPPGYQFTSCSASKGNCVGSGGWSGVLQEGDLVSISYVFNKIEVIQDYTVTIQVVDENGDDLNANITLYEGNVNCVGKIVASDFDDFLSATLPEGSYTVCIDVEGYKCEFTDKTPLGGCKLDFFLNGDQSYLFPMEQITQKKKVLIMHPFYGNFGNPCTQPAGQTDLDLAKYMKSQLTGFADVEFLGTGIAAGKCVGDIQDLEGNVDVVILVGGSYGWSFCNDFFIGCDMFSQLGFPQTTNSVSTWCSSTTESFIKVYGLGGVSFQDTKDTIDAFINQLNNTGSDINTVSCSDVENDI